MAVPPFEAFIEPLLRTLATQPSGIDATSAAEGLSAILHLAKEDREQWIESAARPAYVDRTHWARMYLVWAGYVESFERGRWRLTELGKQFVRAHAEPFTADEIAEIVRVAKANSKRQAGENISEMDRAADSTQKPNGAETPDWRRYLAMWRSDKDAVAEFEADRKERLRLLPEVRELIAQFLDGGIDLETFRSSFDKRTRTAWKTFRWSGFSRPLKNPPPDLDLA